MGATCLIRVGIVAVVWAVGRDDRVAAAVTVARDEVTGEMLASLRAQIPRMIEAIDVAMHRHETLLARVEEVLAGPEERIERMRAAL